MKLKYFASLMQNNFFFNSFVRFSNQDALSECISIELIAFMLKFSYTDS